MRRIALLTVCIFLILLTAQAIHPVTATDPTNTSTATDTNAATITETATNTRTPDATEVAYATVVRTALQSVSNVQDIIFDEQDNARVLTISFQTSASTPEDRVAEWMSILDPLSAAMHDQALSTTSIILIASDDNGLVGRFTATAKDLAYYYSKQLTRTQFLNRAKYFSLLPTPTITPTLSKGQAQGTLVQVEFTKTAYRDALNQTATWTAFNLRATQIRKTIEAPIPVSSGGGVSSGVACPNVNYTCSRLTCEQAYACLAAGDNRLDGDHDGKPCESQCGG